MALLVGGVVERDAPERNPGRPTAGERLPFILLRYLQRNTTIISTGYRVLLGMIILLLVVVR